jgi:hypothetical protein
VPALNQQFTYHPVKRGESPPLNCNCDLPLPIILSPQVTGNWLHQRAHSFHPEELLDRCVASMLHTPQFSLRIFTKARSSTKFRGEFFRESLQILVA